MRQMLNPRLLSAALTLGVLAPVAAQETGEMLRFDGRVLVRFEITESLARRGVGEVVYESPPSSESQSPFNRVLVNGRLPDGNLDLQIGWATAQGVWEDWSEASLHVFENGRFWARLDLPGRSARRLRIRVSNRGTVAPGTVEIFAVEVLDAGGSESAKTAPTDRPAEALKLSDKTVPMPAVIDRQEWGAQPPIGVYYPHDPYRFTQHHTAGSRVQTLEDGMAEMRFIQDFHQNGRGWQDIGYHYCVDDAGRIYEGVPSEFRGAHTGGHNTGNLGISLFGNFEISGEVPTSASTDGLIAMWSWLAFTYGVNPDMLFGHRDYTATSCPGGNFYAELPDMRTGIRKTLAAGGPYVANPAPQPFSLEVSPESDIVFQLKDDEEGVDFNSIVVRVNHEPVMPSITGDASEFLVLFRPAVPFPSSQNVVVEVEASDLATSPNTLHYTFSFTIEVQAVHVEVDNAGSMRNADLEISGTWSSDVLDVGLSGLLNGERLLAEDDDGSHIARVYPIVEAAGDYRVLMAVSGLFLGESAHYRFVNSVGAEHPRVVEYNAVFDSGWSVLSPSPVHFDSAGQGDAFVELSGLTGLPTMLVLDAFRLERVDRLDPPTAPTLKWARVPNPATREVDLAWYPSLEGDIKGYRLFASADGRTWGAPVVDESTLTAATSSYTHTCRAAPNRCYFRMVAVDVNGVEHDEGVFEPFLSEPTDTYGVGFDSGVKVLIVDNFDRRASWPLAYHPFVRSHGDAIAASGIAFDSCTKTAVQTGEIRLADYDAVFYFCGDDSRSHESLAAADQHRLLDYLRNGGKLFISGSEIGYDFDSTTPAELERTRNLLKATYAGDLAGSNRVIGAAGTPFDGLDFQFGTKVSEDSYIEDYPDYIHPAGGSRVALEYGNSRSAAVSYTGPYGAGNPHAQLVYLAFTFETINEIQDRAAVIGSVLRYFGFPTYSLPAPRRGGRVSP